MPSLRHALFALTVCRVASADDPAFLRAGPPPLRRAEAREVAGDEDELARRPWEAGVALGIAAPLCRGVTASGESLCDDLATGGAVGLAARYRLTPFVALGLAATRAVHRADDRGGVESRGRTTTAGLAVRAYFLDRGGFDPWIETRLGSGTSEVTARTPSGVVTWAGGGLSTGVAAGAGFSLGPDVRVGPEFAYDHVLVGSWLACDPSGACARHGASEGGPVGVGRVSITLDVGFGRPM